MNKKGITTQSLKHNKLSWLSNLFSKKKAPELYPEEQALSKRKWDGFDFFSKGQDCYLNRQTSEALTYFDKAIEYGFEEYFSCEAPKLYDLRAGCLQILKYHYDAINDFDKSISIEPNDCNKYFSRSVSKGFILDFEGEIADLEIAIQHSKIDNFLNREYNDEARKQGHKNGAAGIFEIRLLIAKMKLESEIKSREQIKNAKTPSEKEFYQKIYDERREERLSQIKIRCT